jgi:hypothetical protein
MALDLETLRKEVEMFLDQSGTPVFHGYHRMLDALNQISWDVDGHPDFREFIEAGRKAGAKIIVFSHRAFSLDQIDDALDQLEDSNLTREEKRNFETRLRQLQAYEGFTCSLELSFNLDGQVYLYELYTDWYQAMNDILAELDALVDVEEEGDDTLGGYFSKN